MELSNYSKTYLLLLTRKIYQIYNLYYEERRKGHILGYMTKFILKSQLFWLPLSITFEAQLAQLRCFNSFQFLAAINSSATHHIFSWSGLTYTIVSPGGQSQFRLKSAVLRHITYIHPAGTYTYPSFPQRPVTASAAAHNYESHIELARIDREHYAFEFMLKSHLFTDKVVLQGLHDLPIVLVHIDV